MQMIRITKGLRMRGTRTGSLSTVCSRYIKNSKEALKSVYLLLPVLNVSLMINMPRQKWRKSHHQITEIARGRIIDMQECGFSYPEIAARMQCNVTTVMRIWKKWTEENQARRKPGSWAVTDRSASSRVLEQRWSNLYHKCQLFRFFTNLKFPIHSGIFFQLKLSLCLSI